MNGHATFDNICELQLMTHQRVPFIGASSVRPKDPLSLQKVSRLCGIVTEETLNLAECTEAKIVGNGLSEKRNRKGEPHYREGSLYIAKLSCKLSLHIYASLVRGHITRSLK